MARTNINTLGVFINIVGKENEISSYDLFLKTQDRLKIPSNNLNTYIEKYKLLVTKNRSVFEELSELEDKILRLRVIENLNPMDIKFSILREYIYARTPFHRCDKDAKDVRSLVGLTSVYGTDIEKYYENEVLINISITKLTKLMIETIKLNEW
jgi:hypothetical protein